VRRGSPAPSVNSALNRAKYQVRLDDARITRV
jgi:hypothetical protein